jgi:sugar lactone lactonase YvrE
MRVQVFNKSGTYLSQKTFEQTPQAIAIDATEKIFIAHSSNVIAIHDKNWNYIDHFGYTGSTGDSFEFNYIAGISVDVTGKLHVADRNNNSYKVFGVSPQTLTGPLSQPLLTGAPTYLVPAGTNAYRSTHTYTLDSGVLGIKLSEYDETYTGGWKPLSLSPSSVSMSYSPQTLATIEMPATTQYRVGVTALSTQTKLRSVISEFYTNPGKPISIAGHNGVVSPMFAFNSIFGGQLNAPHGVAHGYYYGDGQVSPGESSLFISDTSNHRVLRYSLSGGTITYSGVYGSGPANGDNGLNTPMQVAHCYKNKRIAIADSGNHRIVVRNLITGVFFKVGTAIQGTNDGQFSFPFGVAFDMNGRIVIADRNNNRIQIFNNGVHIRTWGTTVGITDGQLNYPRSVAVNAIGHVIVADNTRVQIFDEYGTFITKLPGSFDKPSVAVDNSTIGNIIVTDYSNHKIHLFTSGGTLLRTFGSLGSGNGEFNEPTGVTVDAAGRMYVSERLNHRISIFTNPAPPQQAGGGGGAN